MTHRHPITVAVAAVLLLGPAVANVSAGSSQMPHSMVRAAVAEASAGIIPSRVADISPAMPGQIVHVAGLLGRTTVLPQHR